MTRAQPAWRCRVDQFGVRTGLAVWLLAMLAIGGTLLARHAVALPRPTGDAVLARSIASMRGPADVGQWMVVHVLYAECQCSRRLVDHLLSTPRPRDVVETVLLAGRNDDWQARLTAGGFRVIPVRPADLADRYHVTAAPLLIVSAPDDSLRYVGGYTSRKQGPDVRDLDIIADAQAQRASLTLPVLGCAVSEKLRAALNPLGLP